MEGCTFMGIFSNKKLGIIYTLAMSLLLICTILAIINYMYAHSEREAFEKLRLETTKQKKSISLQITSDRETLSSMASLIGTNYNSNEGYIEVCKNFEAFGLCKNIGILVPGDVLITKHGLTDVKGKLSFEAEKSKGSYISGAMQDVTNPNQTVIRNSVPIVDAEENTKAILFGTIESDEFSDYYKNQPSMSHSYLAVVDGSSGEFVIDTKNILKQKNITNLASIEYNKGYTYKDFVDDIVNGVPGYVSFVADDSDEYLYVYYDSLGIQDWCIMLAQPESVSLAGVYSTVSFLVLSSIGLCLIIIIYVLGIAIFNRRKGKLNFVASEIRKNLLEINHRQESLIDALQILTKFVKSRSAFVSDSYEEECHYIIPEKIRDKLNKDEIQYFNNKLLYYTSRNRQTHGVKLYSSKIKANRKNKYEMPEFYEFMVKHNINSVVYTVIINNSSNIYILGVLNPGNRDVDQLLNKVAACFSMAVYNRKHLERTHQMALTDSLTETKNRMAFSKDVKNRIYEDIGYTCIYIDVNELNYYNNKYGHSAGDQMLKYIGESLKNKFFDSDIYRMGGDEFLILSSVTDEAEINDRLKQVNCEIEEMKYHIAIGVQYCTAGTSLEDAVNNAEKMMYQNKANYYQEKEFTKVKSLTSQNIAMLETGVKELDACLSVMSIRYLGVYFVSLEKDSCVKILAPAYFHDIDDQGLAFSAIMKRYISEFVKPNFHRAFLSFLEYDILKKQFKEQHIPEISFERIDGEKVVLRIYPVDSTGNESDCIWAFEKETR